MMHELGITESILQIALSQAEKQDAKKIVKINLRIGELSEVVEDCVRFYFDLISKGTIAEGASIDVENMPVRVRCSQCKGIFEAPDLIFMCPQCQVLSAEIISGKELDVTSIEIE